MNHARILLTSSALFLAVVGLVLTFAADELLGVPNTSQLLTAQLLGAAICGFAFLNWMSKATLMGGIYGRPLAIGNFAHFMIGCFALGKAASGLPHAEFAYTLAAVYGIFAAGFAWLAFFKGTPTK